MTIFFMHCITGILLVLLVQEKSMEELKLHKETAIHSFNVWASLGKPHRGAAFNEMRTDKAAYKLAIRSKGRTEFC